MSEELKKSIENVDSKEELMEKPDFLSDEAMEAVSGGENDDEIVGCLRTRA